MFKKATTQKIKNALVIIIVGSILSIVPFYFETRAMTNENGIINKKQDIHLKEHDMKIQNGIVNDAIEKTESEQVKETLIRIESKLDRLIEKQVSLIN
jgi:hypothetical protein